MAETARAQPPRRRSAALFLLAGLGLLTTAFGLQSQFTPLVPALKAPSLPILGVYTALLGLHALLILYNGLQVHQAHKQGHFRLQPRRPLPVSKDRLILALTLTFLVALLSPLIAAGLWHKDPGAALLPALIMLAGVLPAPLLLTALLRRELQGIPNAERNPLAPPPAGKKNKA